jgi:hypothetical protein
VAAEAAGQAFIVETMFDTNKRHVEALCTQMHPLNAVRRPLAGRVSPVAFLVQLNLSQRI